MRGRSEMLRHESPGKALMPEHRHGSPWRTGHNKQGQTSARPSWCEARRSDRAEESSTCVRNQGGARKIMPARCSPTRLAFDVVPRFTFLVTAAWHALLNRTASAGLVRN